MPQARTKKPRWLGPDDHIVTMFADRAAGPGWANRIFWCVVQTGNDRNLRLECIQANDAKEMNIELDMLFDVSFSTHNALLRAFERLTKERKSK